MGRRQPRNFRPELDSLEDRRVMSASNPIVHTAIVPVAVPIAIYNNTFTQITSAFYAYEGPLDDTLNAIGSFASTVASEVLSPGSTDDSGSSSSDYVLGGKDDPVALQSRLIGAISKLPGGEAEADALVNRTFTYGGLTPSDAPYFKAKLTSLVKHEVTQEINSGDMVLVWPGEAVPGRRS